MPRPPAPGAATNKTSRHAAERDTPRVQQARPAYRQRIAPLALRPLKCVDEAGVHLAMTRLYGRAPRGERVIGSMPQHDGANITRLGALGRDGLQAVMTVEGATDADVFRAYVKQVRDPTWAPGDIVVRDNLAAHQATGIQQALARRRARRRYLPPYSPDWSPMARCVSQLKTTWRAAKARTREALETAIQKAMETVTAMDARHGFRPCGYAL